MCSCLAGWLAVLCRVVQRPTPLSLTLSAGEEHDAAEAIEEAVRLVSEELQAAFSLGAAQLAAQAAWASVLGPAPPLLGRCSSKVDGEAAGTAEHAAAAAMEPPHPPLEPAGDAVLRGWRRAEQLPLRGSNAHELQCLRCRHRSTVQLAADAVLSLAIPTARGATLLGDVPAAPGASVEGCLADAFGYEALQGVRCTRCSLVASLEAGAVVLGTDGSTATEGTPAAAEAGVERALHEARRLRQALESGGQLAESEAYERLLLRAGAGAGCFHC